MNRWINIYGDVVVLGTLIKGAGNRFVLVITYDEANDLGEALQNVVADIGVGKTLANEASDTYAYSFEIEGRAAYKFPCEDLAHATYKWGIEYSNDEDGDEVVHVEWFTTEEERNRLLKGETE